MAGKGAPCTVNPYGRAGDRQIMVRMQLADFWWLHSRHDVGAPIARIRGEPILIGVHVNHAIGHRWAAGTRAVTIAVGQFVAVGRANGEDQRAGDRGTRE